MSVLPYEKDAGGGDGRHGPGLLAMGAVTAALASSCCLGPFLLVSLGFSGAWIGHLSVMEPYRLCLLLLAFSALLVAGIRLFRPIQACDQCALCTSARPRRAQQICFCAVAVLAVAGLVFPWFAHLMY